MKNTFGNNLCVTLFGESHGEAIGAVLDGIAPGIKINYEYIDAMLSQRRPYGKISTGRCEKDEYKLASGVFNGYTTGTPICILVPNSDTRSGDYESLKTVPRPSHADLVANEKYHGYQDYRGGGHFSGRVTVTLVIAGAILKSALEAKGIKIGTHISSLKGISDRRFDNYAADIDTLSKKQFAVLDTDKEKEMYSLIEAVAADGDSVGGILETAIIGMPCGVGEPWFDTLEGMLSHAIFSVPAVKGVEFGKGFAIADMLGSEANDGMRYESGNLTFTRNNSGGIIGGISTGAPIVIRSAIKPTPSIFKEQESVNITTKANATLKINGRHDPAILHRARVVIDSVCALTIADMLVTKYGTDYLMA